MPEPASSFGAYSEVGALRRVLVCAPGLAHERLTPSNADGLLFDDRSVRCCSTRRARTSRGCRTTCSPST